MTAPAFVVLAHRSPHAVARLARRLAPLRVHVHVDASAPEDVAAGFDTVGELDNVMLLPRQRTGWASWGLVSAALDGLRHALVHDRPSHVMLLSGQDYPLQSAADIAWFFDEYRDHSFIARWPLPTRLWGRFGGMERVRFPNLAVAGRRVIVPVPRRLPRDLDLYGGSMWWALTESAGRNVLETVDRRPDLVRFFRRAWIPDELFVPTLAMNGPDAECVINESLTFLRWSNPGSPHPDTLSVADIDALVHAGTHGSHDGGWARRKLFARKFDPDDGPDVFDRIDQRLGA